MYRGLGKITYDRSRSRIIAEIDGEIVRYYFSLIPLYKQVVTQAFKPHITIVRSPPKEVIPLEKREECKKWDKKGEIVRFIYDGVIHFRNPYFYLNVWSEDIKKIREELGLPQYRDGFRCYHITLGNVKEDSPNR